MLRRYQWWSLLLLNLNVIHMRSNWLCWKAQEKFQVESRFCKTIGCSYVTLFTTYLAKKTMFKVSNRNTRKRCLLISKLTLKTSERRHLTTSYLPEVTVQNHILDSLQCQFPIKSLLSSSTAHNFNNSRPIFYEKSEIITELFDSWKIQNVTIFFLNKQPQKRTNFSTFYP